MKNLILLFCFMLLSAVTSASSSDTLSFVNLRDTSITFQVFKVDNGSGSYEVINQYEIHSKETMYIIIDGDCRNYGYREEGYSHIFQIMYPKVKFSNFKIIIKEQ